MIRTLGVAERWNDVAPPSVITVAATTPTVVIPDQKYLPKEIAYRFIQNTGANTLYYSFGIKGAGYTDAAPTGQCDNVATYHGMLLTGQQLDCGQGRGVVTVYSVLGTTVSTTIIYRNTGQTPQ